VRRVAQTAEEKKAKRRERWAEAFEMVERGEAHQLTCEAVALIEAEGLGIAELAERLGKGRSTVAQALADPRREKDRQRKQKVFRHCESCGRKVYNAGSLLRMPKRCARCTVEVKKKERRAEFIEAVHDFHHRYGRIPSAMDWNISMAREKAHPRRLAEVEALHRDRKWPWVQEVLRVLGRWNNLIAAAGYTPTPPGQHVMPEKWKANRKGAQMKSSVEVLETEIERNKQRRESLSMREQKLRDERESLSEEAQKLEQAIGVLKQG
jgi:hypothetical protein